MPRLLIPCTMILCALLAAIPARGAETVELRYDGKLVQKSRKGEDREVKSFAVLALVDRDDAGKPLRVFWQTEERGSGWAWPESYGQIDFQSPEAEGNRTPQVQHTHDNLPWPLPLPHLIFTDRTRLQEGKRWVEGRHEFEVGGVKKQGERQARSVTMATNFGRSHEMQVDDARGILLAAKQKVFMGQGDEFELQFELNSETPLEPERREKTDKARGLLLELQKKLGRDAGTTRVELSAEQLSDVQAWIADIETNAENTALQSLSVEIHRDLKLQTQKLADLTTLAAKFLGRKAPALELTRLDETRVPADEIADKIVVLHFWKYHDDPLREPYGQVGYLDYLQSRRGKLGVKFIGVAVDPKLADPTAKRGVQRAVKKLVEFMNISYTLTQDDGTLLKSFGDPRASGGELPLWVVISPSGEIVHYHVGFYDVKPEEGLAELDRVLVEQIKAKRASAEGDK